METTLLTARQPECAFAGVTIVLVDVRDVRRVIGVRRIDVTEVKLRVEAPGAAPVALRLGLDETGVAAGLRITVVDAGLGRERAADAREQGFAKVRLEPLG